MTIRHRPRNLQRGGSTAFPANVRYRIGKLSERGLLRGDWLDCGCADGGYTAAIARGGARCVVGIDVEESRLAQARQRYRDLPRVHFISARSEELPFEAGSFDGVFMNEVLEHVDDEALTLKEVCRVLRPNGHLALFSPNRFFPFEAHGIRFTQKTSLPFPVPFIPWLPARMTSRFVEARNYWPWELRHIVEEHGLATLEVTTVFPVFEAYRLLPRHVIELYRRNLPKFERIPLLRHFGVSTFVLATSVTSNMPSAPTANSLPCRR
jgi:ubiquinone/menaquinone biosynthesis C-methylase UbiE